MPVTGDLYYAAADVGSYKVERVGGTTEIESLDAIIGASVKLPEKDSRAFTVVGSRSHMTPETEAYINQLEEEHGEVEIISKGSSLKICMVAEGKADVYPRFAPTMEWDTAAGHAIAKYAGFSMTHHDNNEPLRYNKADLLNPWFIVK